jgi:hypothetical protein
MAGRPIFRQPQGSQVKDRLLGKRLAGKLAEEPGQVVFYAGQEVSLCFTYSSTTKSPEAMTFEY